MQQERTIDIAKSRFASPQARKAAMNNVLWRDHGILRTYWTNFGEVSEGVYRSNQPNHARLAKYRSMGINTILNLRGTSEQPQHLFEAESCENLDMNLVSIALHARYPAQPDMLKALFQAFDQIERPFLMHCKSGADRAGLAAALYRLDKGEPIENARRELSFRYLHLKFTKTGVQDHMLDLYEARQSQGPIGIRDWIMKEYDPVQLYESFQKLRTLPL